MTDFDVREFLPYLLNQAAEASSQSFARVYKDRYGLLRTEWRVLFHLGIFDQMTASEIGARASIHKTKISRAVARLEARRFLTRETVKEDRRQEILRLTPAGRVAYEDLRSVAERHDRDLLVGFSEEEVALLRGALKRLAGAVP